LAGAAENPIIVAVQGATASGKSDLALRIALSFGGEIVNADSVQLYREFDIGTAKPTAEDRAAVPHHLYDVLDPTEQSDAGRYIELAHAAIADIAARGKLPVAVGTGCGPGTSMTDSMCKAGDGTMVQDSKPEVSVLYPNRPAANIGGGTAAANTTAMPTPS